MLRTMWQCVSDEEADSVSIIAEREARQVIESQCHFCIYIYIYVCCNAGRGYGQRAGLNQYDSINMNPCNLRPSRLSQPAGWRGWQEERSNSLEGRKPVVQRHRNACSPATDLARRMAESWTARR